MQTRMPPINEQAEQALLGCVMQNPATVLYQCNQAGITEASFYVSSNRLLYATMLEIAAQHGPARIDLLTVGDALIARGSMDRIGGEPYLAKCYDAGVAPQHALDIVIDKANRRDIIRAMRGMEEGAFDPEVTVEDTISDFVSKMIELGAGKSRRKRPDEIHDEQKQEWTLIQEGKRVGIPPRWLPLETLVSSFKSGNLIVVGASPSDGKTMLALNQTEHTARECKIPVAFGSAEMTERELRTRLACSMAGVNARRMASPYATPEDWERVSDAFNELAKLPIYIEDANMTIDGWCMWGVNMKARYNVGMIIFDYLQLIQIAKEDKRRPRTEVVGEMSHSFKRLAKRLDIPVMVLSQFNRGDRRERDKTPPPPTLAALRDSGEIEQDADVVILLSKREGLSYQAFEDDSDWQMTLSVGKNRNGPTGKLPFVMMRKEQRWVSEQEYESINKNG
jgi:replicative DNA helicase